jgi:hypothetical protein
MNKKAYPKPEEEAAIYNGTIRLFESLNIIEQLAFLGYAPEEVTSDTCLYVDTDGAICGLEKHNHKSRRADMFYGGHYAITFGPLNEVRATLREFLALS